MYCNHCGKQIKDDAKFCPFCGATTQDESTKELPKKSKKQRPSTPKKKVSKGKVIFVAVLALVIVGLIGSVSFVFTSPAHQLTSRLKKQDYERVEALFETKVKGNFIQCALANRFLQSGITNIMEDYGASKVGFEVAKDYLATVGKLSGIDAADEATFQLDKLNTLSESKAAYEAAEAYYAAGNYAAAISEYQNVSKEDTVNYENAQTQIKTATDSYRTQLLEKVGTPSTVEQFKSAITMLETALKVMPNDAELSSKLSDIQSGYASNVKSTAMTDGTKALADENYSKAFDLIQTALELNPDDSDLLTLLASSESTYESYIIETVDGYISEDNYNKAINELSTALKVLPDSSTLSKKLTEVQENQPVSLSTLNPINGGFDWDEGTPEDPFGNTYNDAANFVIFGGVYKEEFSAEYRVYGEYSQFCFSIAPYKDIPENASAQVKIYADDQLVFTADKTVRKSDKKDYKVKINNAEYIKIVVSIDPSWSKNCVLLDCTLRK